MPVRKLFLDGRLKSECHFSPIFAVQLDLSLFEGAITRSVCKVDVSSADTFSTLISEKSSPFISKDKRHENNWMHDVNLNSYRKEAE